MEAKSKPLDIVVERLAGGNRAELARILGVHKSVISNWADEKRRPAGAVGTIPQKYQGLVMREARKRGVNLSADEILGFNV